MIVSWFSAGASSAVATKLALQSGEAVRIIYIHIDDQHEDTMRFLRECQDWFGVTIEILHSRYGSVENACRAASFLNSPHGAACTTRLKKHVRKQWEREHAGGEPLTYVWGMDVNEAGRRERLIDSNPDQQHTFPLIDNGITKESAHGMLAAAGIARPKMYDLGYPNNNCIGCLKGGMGYWNKVRSDFPEVFASRARLERMIGASVLKQYYLDELPLDAGKECKIVVPDCGLFCELPSQDVAA